jgi:hypothetical protein
MLHCPYCKYDQKVTAVQIYNVTINKFGYAYNILVDLIGQLGYTVHLESQVNVEVVPVLN